jgi:predicted phage terminase large subunit-like protein
MRERVFAIVSMPPRHAKTTTVRRAFACAIKRYPDRLNGLGMHSQPAADKESKAIRRIVRDEGIRLADDTQAAGLWLTEQGGGLFATGANGQWTGKGIDGLLVLDDILKGRRQAESPAQRGALWDTLTDDILTRPEPPCGSVIMVATRWHADDPAGRLLAHGAEDPEFPQFEVINLPALRDPITGQPSDADDALALWPERFPVKELKSRRATSEYGWNSLFQGTPRPRGGTVFKTEPGRYEGKGYEGRRIVLALDGAGTESTRADYTVALALAFAGTGDEMTCNVLDMFRVQLEPQDTARLLAPWVEKWGGGLLHIESSRDGKSIAKALRSLTTTDRGPGLRIEEIPPIGDKFMRAQPVAAAWNGKPSRVRVPMDATAHPWLVDFLDEFPKFTGAHDKRDDIIDALSHGWNVAVGSAATGDDRAVAFDLQF